MKKDLSYKSILLIKPGAIGDLLQITPTVRALRKRFPAARITVMVGIAGTMPLFIHNPDVNEVLAYDRKGKDRGVTGLWRLLVRVFQARYDLVVNYQRSSLATWLISLAARPRRILVYHKTRSRRIHAVQNHLEAVSSLGIDAVAADCTLELHLSPDDEAYAEQLLADAGLAGRPLIALNPGASNLIKCWSPEKFARLADRLQQELGVGVVVVGGPGEQYLYDAMEKVAQLPPLNLIAKTSLLRLGAILKRCVCLVSGDTGPLHLATAVGTRVVALFGAIDPDRTGPVGAGHVVIRHDELACVPCNGRECANPVKLECMDAITVDEVFSVVQGLIRQESRCAS